MEPFCEKRGQHWFFDVPLGNPLADVYAFAAQQGVTVLDVVRRGVFWRVKAIDPLGATEAEAAT